MNATSTDYQSWILADEFSVPLHVILSVIIVVVNSSFLVVMLHDRQLTSNFDVYSISLAVSDLGVGLFSVPRNIFYRGGPWPFGLGVCLVWGDLAFTLSTVSLYSLCAMSYDRYVSVTRPIYHKTQITRRRSVLICVFMWAAGFVLISIIPLIQYLVEEFRQYLTNGTCVFSLQYYSLAYVAVIHYIPRGFPFYAFARLLQSLKTRMLSNEEHLADHSRDPRTRRTLWNTDTSGHHPMSLRKPQKHTHPTLTKQNRRCIKTVSLIVATYIFCWAPSAVIWIVTSAEPRLIPQAAYYLGALLNYLFSAINTCIYFLTKKELRKRLKLLLGRVVCDGKT